MEIHPSPKAAARRIARSPSPAISTGGMTAPGERVTSSPSSSTAGCPVTSAGSTRRDSSVRRPRSANDIPAARQPMSPCTGLPVPTPSAIRLPDTYCSELICLAAQAGGRSASSITP